MLANRSGNIMRQRLLVKVQLVGDQNAIEKRLGITTGNLQRVIPGRQREFYNLVVVTVAVDLIPMPGISFVYYVKLDPVGVPVSPRVADGAGDPDPERVGASYGDHVEQDFVGPLRNGEIVGGDTIDGRILSLVLGALGGPDVLAARGP